MCQHRMQNQPDMPMCVCVREYLHLLFLCVCVSVPAAVWVALPSALTMPGSMPMNGGSLVSLWEHFRPAR
jgi:hypothetical protein